MSDDAVTPLPSDAEFKVEVIAPFAEDAGAVSAPPEIERQPTYEALPFSARVDEPFGISAAMGEVKEVVWNPPAEPNERRQSLEKRDSVEAVEPQNKRKSITPSAAAFSEIDSRKLYSGPLFMHKWYNPLENLGPALAKSDDSSDPIKMTLPFGKVCLGLAPSIKQAHAEVAVEAPPATQTWYIFSTAGEDAAARAKIHACLLRFLLPADLVFVATMYFQTMFASSDAESYLGMTDDLAFASTLLGVTLGFVAMWQKDPRLLTIFICTFIVDSLVNLIRLTTIFQFVQFALQLLICYVGGQFQAILGTSWFPSSYTRD